MKATAFKKFITIAAFTAAAASGRSFAQPSYDLYLRADSGAVFIWLDTATGDFRWLDRGRSIDIEARGALNFPNLGPIVLSYAGKAPGYDWVSLALKIYGTRATGSMTIFPEGEPVRKIVSLFYDKDTRDDKPSYERTKRKPQPPKVEGLKVEPPVEIPAVPKTKPARVE